MVLVDVMWFYGVWCGVVNCYVVLPYKCGVSVCEVMPWFALCFSLCWDVELLNRMWRWEGGCGVGVLTGRIVVGVDILWLVLGCCWM